MDIILIGFQVDLHVYVYTQIKTFLFFLGGAWYVYLFMFFI